MQLTGTPDHTLLGKIKSDEVTASVLSDIVSDIAVFVLQKGR